MDDTERIDKLVKQFNGLIKYAPMLKDHPDWTDEQCVAFAREQHARALKQRKINAERWNNGIPYCRNIWREDLA
jgi:hypothetical protein